MPATVLLCLLLLAHHRHSSPESERLLPVLVVFQTRSALFEHRKSRDREFARRRTDYHLWGGDYTYPLNPAEARATRKNLRRSKAGDRELERVLFGAGRSFLRKDVRMSLSCISSAKDFRSLERGFWSRCAVLSGAGAGQGAGGWTA